MAGFDKLRETFRCAKCRGKSPVIKEIRIPLSSLHSLLPLASGKYILVTCSLCGYTEIYDAARYVHAEDEVTNEAKISEQAPPI